MNDEQIEELTILCGEATKGPWRIDEDSRPGGANIVQFADGKAVCFMPSDGPYEDGEFIVAAREALPECLRVIQEMAEQLGSAECEIYEIEADKAALRHEAVRLESLLAKARKGLEFYGDQSLYEANAIAADHSHLYALIENDKGETARKTLAVLDAVHQVEEGE